MPIYINGVPYRNLEDQVKYLTERYNDYSAELERFNQLVPVTASIDNKLTTEQYVASVVNNLAAHYLTSSVDGNSFATKAALLAGPYYYKGELHTPDENDYAFVKKDADHDNLSARYVYQGEQWNFQYTIQADGVDLTSAQTISGHKQFNAGITFGANAAATGNNFIGTTANALHLGSAGRAVFIDNNLAPSGQFNKDLGYVFNNVTTAWRNLYLSGEINIDGNVIKNNESSGLSVYDSEGNSKFEFGTTAPYNISDLTLIPRESNTYDLGISSERWKDLHLDGKTYLYSTGNSNVWYIENDNTYGQIRIGLNNGRYYTMSNNMFVPNVDADLGTSGYRWKDLHIKGKIDFGTKISGRTNTSYIVTDAYDGIGFWVNGNRTVNIYDNAVYLAKNLLPNVTNIDIGDASHKFKDLYLSGEIVGSYQEANETSYSASAYIATFNNMDAATVNKIKYIEVTLEGESDCITFNVPVASINLSGYANYEIKTNGYPIDHLLTVYNNNTLSIAVPYSDSSYTAHIFVKYH